MRKVLVEQKVSEAQDLLASVLSGRRQLRPGILIRYYFYGLPRDDDDAGEAQLFTGTDRIETLRKKEPRVFLERLQRWVFGKECAILPNDSHYSVVEARHQAKVDAAIHKRTGKTR